MIIPRISLRAARVNAQLTLSEAARKLGISASTLSNYENGYFIPKFETLVKMESVYHFPIDGFFLKKNLAISENERCDHNDQPDQQVHR